MTCKVARFGLFWPRGYWYGGYVPELDAFPAPRGQEGTVGTKRDVGNPTSVMDCAKLLGTS